MNELLEIQRELRNLGTKKSVRVFNPPYQELALFLSQQLTQDMNIAEMGNLLAIVEQIKVDKSIFGANKKPQDLSMLTKEPYSLPAALIESFTEQGKKKIAELAPATLSSWRHNEFLSTVDTLHNTLIKMIGSVTLKAKNDSNYYETTHQYSARDISFSGPLTSIETASKKERLRDEAKTSLDFSRGTTIKIGDEFLTGGVESVIKEKIEAFTGDKVLDKGSKANKIFNFGGQYLQAEAQTEFNIATEMNDSRISTLGSKGVIHWRKNDERDIEAEVIVDVLSITEGKETTKFYVLDSEGKGLVLEDIEERAEALLKNLKKGAESTSSLRAPIGSIKMILFLAKENNEHFLKVKQTTISYNAKELECTRKELPEQILKWPPIKDINRVDLNNYDSVSICAGILSETSEEEWKIIAKNARDNTIFKVKLAELFLKIQVYKPMQDHEIENIHENILTCYDENEFQKFQNEAYIKLKIEDSIENLTRLFKRIKSNDPTLSLQDIAITIKNICKNETSREGSIHTLVYLLKRMNSQNNFHLTTHDFQKISTIDRTAKTHYKDQPGTTFISYLNLAMRGLSQDKVLHDTEFQDGKFKESPLQPEKKDYYEHRILLCTEAKRHTDNISQAHQIIIKNTPEFKESSSERNALISLHDKLLAQANSVTKFITISGNKKIPQSTRALKPQELQNEIQSEKRQLNNLIAGTDSLIDQTTLIDTPPSSLFMSFIEKIKNIFKFRKSPSPLEETVTEVRTKIQEADDDKSIKRLNI